MGRWRKKKERVGMTQVGEMGKRDLFISVIFDCLWGILGQIATRAGPFLLSSALGA